MAKTFDAHIMGENTRPITVLPLPAGTGKTQGLCLYCSMLSKAGGYGVLIVTALKDEATKIAEEINGIADKPIALAEHGDSRNSEEAISSAQILIITHSAYQNAMDAETGGKQYKSKWGKYVSWDHGRRRLTVIDEAIDIVDQFNIKYEELRLLKSIIPSTGLSADGARAEQAVNAAFERLDGLVSGIAEIKQYELIHFSDCDCDADAFKSLRRDIVKHLGIHFSFKAKDVDVRQSLATFVKKILDNLEKVIASWSIYYNSGAYNGLSTARFILPLELNNVIVLDATASKNPVTRVLNDYTDVVSLPSIKSYANLTLHISIGHSVGQNSMKEITQKEWGAIFDRLNGSELKDCSAPLLCVHKDTETLLSASALPKDWSIMHWGAINGSNDWKHCDSVVVYGLPYIPEHICATTLMAFWDWGYKIRERPYSKDILHSDLNYIKTTYQWLHIIVSLVQAINRAHCRRMTEAGNCPETKVYLFTLHEEHSVRLKHHLAELMPDIIIKDWDAPKSDSNSKGLNGTEQKIVDALSQHTFSYLDVTVMLDEAGINRYTFNNNYPKDLSKKKGRLHDAITAIGWEYLKAKEAKEIIGIYKQHFIKTSELED